MLFWKKRKEELQKGEASLAKGIYLKQSNMDCGNKLMNCLLRSVVVFLLTFGTIGGFLSAFSISYNYILVILAYAMFAIYFAYLYSIPKPLYRDIGYILFFILFIGVMMQIHRYANSGFYEVVNRMLEHAQVFFDLSGVRQYETWIDQEYLTIAIFAVLIGMVLIMILNIWLYSTMNLGLAIMITFPVLVIPVYMELVPDAIYLIALGTGYVFVAFFNANGHYFAYSGGNSFQVKGMRRNRISYTKDGVVFRQVLLRVVMLFFFMVIIAEAFVPYAVFQRRFKNDWLREKTADTIGNFVLLGFSGLYNHYSATGGLSGGQLGGISNVRPDYQTDLVVTYAPYSNEAVYLKGYTGGLYGDNQWLDIYSDVNSRNGQTDVELFADESMMEEALTLKAKFHEQSVYNGSGVMDITNVGADINYMYYPYYTNFSDYSVFSNHGILSAVHGIGRYETESYEYYPKIEWEAYLGDVVPKTINVNAVNPIYLDVPDKNVEVIKNECLRIGLTDTMTENEIITAVEMYFEENIPYTLKPGATPRNADVVNYFLTENRKGYCAHFASAATLIFRQMGIPARYVEGYAFDFEAVLASDESIGKVYSDYYKGYSSIGESTVMEVEVSDAMAHAWVEVYVPGFGWKVVEVTPGSNETVDEDSFWDAFSRFLDSNDDNADITINFGELNLSKYSWLVYVVLGIFLSVILFNMVRIGIRKGMRYYRCHVGDKKSVWIAYYADLCDMLRCLDPNFNACRSHREQLEYMRGHFDSDINVDVNSRYLEVLSFSAYSIAERDMEMLAETLQHIRKSIWKHTTWKQWFRLCRR